MKDTLVRNGLTLGVFALVTTGLIALTFSGTEKTIEHQQRQKLVGILGAVIPNDRYDNDMEHDCTSMQDQTLLGSEEPKTIYRARLGSTPIGAAIETVAPDGYSGNIHLVVGVTTDNQVSGVRVLSHKETPGLGDKIDLRVSDWILSFNGQSTDDASKWTVRKDGGQFDQFTGATITPRAVVKAVKKAADFFEQHQDAIFTAENLCAVQAESDEHE